MSEPVHALVFTKRRPMQLHALLDTLAEYAPWATVSVLAARGDDADAYFICRQAHAGTIWSWAWDEDEGFETVVRTFLRFRPRVVFHTDDELMFAPPPHDLLDCDSSQLLVTLRQGRNTTFCHPLQREQQVPERFPWRWRDADLDFAYPLSLNSTVYHSRDLEPLLDFHFTNPTEMEAQLAANAAKLTVEWMTAPEHSCTVSTPHNLVSVSSGNPVSGVPDWGPQALYEAYMDGVRIDVAELDYDLVDAAHVELPLHFRRANG